MNQLMNVQKDELTMSSREIAELTGKRHDTVRISMERLADKGLVTVTPTVEPFPGGGKPVTVLHVNQRDSYVVVAQLSPEFTARLVDRWQELEAKVAKPAPQIPQNFAQALLLAGQLELEREALALEVAQKESGLAVVVPKAEALDTIAAQMQSMNLRDAAKVLGLKPKQLTEQLINAAVVYRDSRGQVRPYQRVVDANIMACKFYDLGPGREPGCQTLVTQPDKTRDRCPGTYSPIQAP